MGENIRNLLLVTAAIVLTTSMISAGTMISNQVYAQAGNSGSNTQNCSITGTESGAGDLNQACNQEAGMCLIGQEVGEGDASGNIEGSDCS